MTHRLFIAAEIPDEALNTLIQIRDELYGTSDNVSWEPKNKLHLTLKFLGDVGENMTEVIIAQLDKIIHDKFTAEFSRFGIFTKDNVPKILWTGLKSNENLTQLKNKVEETSELLGYQKDNRKFLPHVTILRIKGKEDHEKINKFRNYVLPEIKFDIEKILLVKSVLKPGGSEYSTVKSFNLI